MWKDLEQWSLEGHSWKNITALCQSDSLTWVENTRSARGAQDAAHSWPLYMGQTLWAHGGFYEALTSVKWECVKSCMKLLSEKTSMYDTHSSSRIMASSLLPPPKFEINFFHISKSWYANPSLQKGSTEFISFLAESYFPLVSWISSLLLHYKQSQDPSGIWQQAFV